MHQKDQNAHTPVLLDAVIRYLDPKEGDSYLDLTAGYGGHAAAVLERTGNPIQSVLVDRDQQAIAQLEGRFAGQGARLIHADFHAASRMLQEERRSFNCILADLGVSSPHLNQADRGFSIQLEGPLDMRMDQSQQLTAREIVNNYSAGELTDIIRRYGEEPKARHIASLIVGNRPYETTSQLAAIVAKAWPGYSRVHPATRTFQALRIAVNDELVLLERSLPIWMDALMKPGGRIAVISFHSLEDRVVKHAFQARAGDRYDAEFRLLTKKPVTAGLQETASNPRARSAKLRAAVKQT